MTRDSQTTTTRPVNLQPPRVAKHYDIASKPAPEVAPAAIEAKPDLVAISKVASDIGQQLRTELPHLKLVEPMLIPDGIALKNFDKSLPVATTIPDIIAVAGPVINDEAALPFVLRQQAVEPIAVEQPQSQAFPPVSIVAARVPGFFRESYDELISRPAETAAALESPELLEILPADVVSIPAIMQFQEQLPAAPELLVESATDMLIAEQTSHLWGEVEKSQFEAQVLPYETTITEVQVEAAELPATLIAQEVSRATEADVQEILAILVGELGLDAPESLDGHPETPSEFADIEASELGLAKVADIISDQAPRIEIAASVGEKLPSEAVPKHVEFMEYVQEQVTAEEPLADVLVSLAQYLSAEPPEFDNEMETVEPGEQSAVAEAGEPLELPDLAPSSETMELSQPTQPAEAAPYEAETEPSITGQEVLEREMIRQLIEDIYQAAYPAEDYPMNGKQSHEFLPEEAVSETGSSEELALEGLIREEPLDDFDETFESAKPPQISKELAVKILVLLETLGYEQPQEVLREFMRYHDLEFLLQAIRHMHQLQNSRERREVRLSSLAPRVQSVDEVPLSLTARIGRALMAPLRSGFETAAAA